ncbi:uncharacterized protein LOC106646625 [Copidosoma floridanum]|uniref:uncharacterized protein LOC106646625 n=1 Tax=Copidosoma floridanum TaxID=29053 RepID=UPI0006C99A3F|nr:uncharacterized protein LOC106646625 [Copidosoma floridanum]XP_014218191.1 uncharacterized protein LOC106646625 [Copidosoma floridanum]
MPHPCVVCGRSRMNPNNKAEEYIFFGFPVNDEPRCKKWLEFCCREELYKLSKKQLLQRMICSKHFSRFDFLSDFSDRLNGTAVPSVYDPKQSLYNISCVLCGRCRKDPPGPGNDDATFHHFPGEEFRCLQWLDFVGVDSYYRLTRKEIMFCYICSKHFHRNQFMPGFHNRLVDAAVPDIKYPDENPQEKDPDGPPNPLGNVELFSTCGKDLPKIVPLPMFVRKGQACAFCGRQRSDPKNRSQKLKFHPFPAYEIGRCLKWCQFLEREDILGMSPNQIRKLVLCSKHFQAGQNFNNGTDPCDAVPTIKDRIVPSPQPARTEPDSEKTGKVLVSSKKPKINSDIKPKPLAKKRGKSKRPTTINLPKIEPKKVNNFIVQKVPIPTTGNWKLIANQFQPITVSNSIMSNVADVKKVILPFSGSISNLGAPIPVNSLSSIPPGLLIKINLPEQSKDSGQDIKRKRRRKSPIQPMKVVHSGDEKAPQENDKCKSRNRFLAQEEDAVKVMESGDVDLQQESEEDESVYANFEEIEFKEEHCQDIVDQQLKEDIEPSIKKKRIREMRPRKASQRCRRTLLPIECQLRQFLWKIKPHVQRLPKKSQAQVKLAIINKVIERL